MVLNEDDFKVFENIGDALKNLMDKLEKQTQEIESDDKAFILGSISSVKEKINNGGDLTAEINKLKDYASNR